MPSADEHIAMLKEYLEQDYQEHLAELQEWLADAETRGNRYSVAYYRESIAEMEAMHERWESGSKAA